MRNLLKTIHLLGVGAGFGGLIAMVVGGDPSGVTGPMIMAGLAVAAISGAAMAARARLSPLRQPWLSAHIAAAVLAGGCAAMFATPAGNGVSSGIILVVAAMSACLLALTIAIGVFKPRFGKLLRY